MRPFLPSEINQMRRIVEAIVPHQCSVHTASINQGWKVSLTICGTQSCHSYNIEPPLNREAIVRLAAAWETGNYAFAPLAPKPADKVIAARNSGDLVVWARKAQSGQRIVYFEGELAQFRQTANTKLRKLHTESDRRTEKTKRWAKKATIMDRLQDQIDLLGVVERLRQANVIDLVQKRKPDGSGAVYFAVRK